LNNFLNTFWICSHGGNFHPIFAIQSLFNVGRRCGFFANFGFLIFAILSKLFALFGGKFWQGDEDSQKWLLLRQFSTDFRRSHVIL